MEAATLDAIVTILTLAGIAVLVLLVEGVRGRSRQPEPGPAVAGRLGLDTAAEEGAPRPT